MAAYELLQPFYQNSTQIKTEVIGATTILYRGNLAIFVAGVGAVPFVRATYAAGAALLGFPRETFDNSLGVTALTRPSKMLFHKGCPFEADGKALDVPVGNDIGSLVSVFDASTVCKTAVTGDLKVILLEIRPGNKFLVMLP